MGSPTRRLPRKRWLAAGLTAGAVLGIVVGAGILTRASTEVPPGPQPTVLHAAPAVVQARTPVDLTLSTYCDDPEAPSCQIVDAVASVTPGGSAGSVPVVGRAVEGVVRFRVTADLVPAAGFSYTFALVTAGGERIAYPPGGMGAAVRVLTTSGLPRRDLQRIDWKPVAPARTVVRLPEGSGPRAVGVAGLGEEGGASGPSSFDVAADGSIVVADWVHARTLRFGPDGRLRGSVALPPGRPLDIAVQGTGVLATTLGTDAQAYELGPDGSVLGRYPIGYGVVSRILAGPVPRVRVGSAQWVPVRGPSGAALPPEIQAVGQTSTVPRTDGSVGVTAVVDGRLVVVWTRPDESRAGAALRLPPGVQAGADYFVRPLPDGGALAVQGVWDERHFAVAAIHLDARGSVVAVTVLPAPTTRMAAPFSTVRSGGDRVILMARDLGDGMRIDRFEVR
jgi:hypothetical protein